MNVQMVLITVIVMQHVILPMDHLIALVTLDIVEMELTVQVCRKYHVLLLIEVFVGLCIFEIAW